MKRVTRAAGSAMAITALSGLLLTAPPAAADPNTVVFEALGTGTALTIDTDPSVDRVYNAPLPWSRTIQAGPDVTLFQVVVVGTGTTPPGCRITLGGQVVAQQPVGGSAHCIYSR
ncbi:MmpS family transport accessory protein [Mycobacterium sp. ML4]